MQQHTRSHLTEGRDTRDLHLPKASFDKEVYVLKLKDFRSHETHNALRSIVESSGGKYDVSCAGRFATVVVNLATARSFSEMNLVTSITHVHGALKIDRRLHLCSTRWDPAGLVVALAVMSQEHQSALLRQLQTLSDSLDFHVASDFKLTPFSESFVRVYTKNCGNLIKAANSIAQLPGVLFIEQVANVFTLNRYAHGTIQTSSPADTSVWEAGLTGAGQIIGIADTGIDLTSCYFYDSTGCDPRTSVAVSPVSNCRKVIKYYKYVDGTDVTESPGHGTHVTGSAVGQCTSEYAYVDDNSKFNGQAYSAKVAFMDIGNSEGTLSTPPNLNTDLFSVINGYAAYVQSHSWANSNAYYDSSAYQADTFLSSNPSAALFMAAGNNGTRGLNTILSPSTAKNTVSVGASISDYESFKALGQGSYSSSIYTYTTVADFSSRGYTEDGRLKPDVLAPGYWIGSAKSNTGSPVELCGQGYLAGTSMSAPNTAGSALLIRQYFTEGWHPGGVKGQGISFIPTGALLKAMMIHGAQKMKGLLDENTLDTSITYPGPEQGYGRIQMDQMIRYSNNEAFTLLVIGASESTSKYYKTFTATGQVARVSVKITNDSSILQPLKATLVWTDPPAAQGSTFQLVNDLDLTITGPDQKVYYPILTGAADHTNNVEKVEIAIPSLHQNYTIQVKVHSLTTASQTFALVVTGTFYGETYVTPVINYSNDDTNGFVGFLQSLGLSTSVSIGLIFIIVAFGIGCGLVYVFWSRLVQGCCKKASGGAQICNPTQLDLNPASHQTFAHQPQPARVAHASQVILEYNLYDI